MNRQIEWLLAVAKIRESLDGLSKINVQDLDILTLEEFDWFASLARRAAVDISRLMDAVNQVTESHLQKLQSRQAQS